MLTRRSIYLGAYSQNLVRATCCTGRYSYTIPKQLARGIQSRFFYVRFAETRPPCQRYYNVRLDKLQVAVGPLSLVVTGWVWCKAETENKYAV
jgi:hypothetical protein